jgi:formylmethanofuran dehydrogenase subunit E
MKAKCEACGTWVNESYMHSIGGKGLCVLCAFQEANETTLVYDLKCSQCGEQLDFYETRDGEGDLLIMVEPCGVCCPAFDSQGSKE